MPELAFTDTRETIPSTPRPSLGLLRTPDGGRPLGRGSARRRDFMEDAAQYGELDMCRCSKATASPFDLKEEGSTRTTGSYIEGGRRRERRIETRCRCGGTAATCLIVGLAGKTTRAHINADQIDASTDLVYLQRETKK